MDVLISAFSCDPELGSEERNGWYTTANLAQLGHQVWVLTHPRGKVPVERAMFGTTLKNLKIIYIDHPGWSKKLIKGSTDWIFLYIVWQWAAYRIACQLHSDINFDIVHHLTWANFKAGSFLWRLGRPFILGPVGGGQVAPVLFKEYFLNDWFRESIRSHFTKHLLKYIPLTY